MPRHPDRIVLHVSGVDRPGVTARLTDIIAAENATLVNIGQSVLHGYLTLSAIVDIPSDSGALRQFLFAASELGMKLEVSAFEDANGKTHREPAAGLCVTALGKLADGKAVAAIAKSMAERGMNIRAIRSLSDEKLNGLELIANLPASAEDKSLPALRGDFLRLGTDLSVDLAVQRDDIFRRNKRLVCMDVDSTFVKGEFIDELADLAGVKDRVSKITARAMQGELDFQAALKERVQLLEGLPLEKVHQLVEKFQLTPGAERFVKILKSLGFRIGLVSGGFDVFVDQLKERFGLDFAFSNELEVQNGILTGRVQGTIVDADRKAQVLKDMTKVFKYRLEQTVAIGDGANDMKMLQTAGLGIAFRAKARLQEVADMSLNHHEALDTLLFLMGFQARDLSLVV